MEQPASSPVRPAADAAAFLRAAQPSCTLKFSGTSLL